MNAKEKAAAINKWQKCGFVHPLTCGKERGHDSCRGLMKATTRSDVRGGDRLVVECSECGWEQAHIPSVVYNLNYDQFDEIKELIQRAEDAREAN